MTQPLPADYLLEILRDARARTFELLDGLEGEQLQGPMLDIVNPLIWEIGHVAWFHENFILRGLDRDAPLIEEADALYDSMLVPHDRRWSLPLPDLAGTLDYMARVNEALEARLESGMASEEDSYFHQLTTFHEDMHDEAFIYTRQTLGYPEPRFAAAAGGSPDDAEAGPLPGDAEVPGGIHVLGSKADERAFVFDNEKWGHEVTVAPFRIARAPVTNAEFAAFVDAGGYEREAWWDGEGWAWRQAEGAGHPVHWRRDGEGWAWRRYDRVVPLEPHQPAIHVNWFEARAWCAWAGRRLPSEAEWEVAASRAPDGEGLAPGRRDFPWGNERPEGRHANLGGAVVGCVDVAAYGLGDSAFGCRQMMGNVWEWTQSPFEPFPGFSVDPYADYSKPWFGDRKVLKGGAWASRGRMLNNRFRNFFTPDRRDIVAGFRTCARD